ncbi:hypothetical protein HYV81_02900 [Candidatus Woesearchaeota archaeon]|nr:hypothetical protein [Candidatus Woesearchaeota archaeon]
MTNGLEALANMEYPGRFIILGQSNNSVDNIVVYGVTARSPPSKARIIEQDGHSILRTEVTDSKVLEQGSPPLLLYPAVVPLEDVMLVSNGAQTNLLYTSFMNKKNLPLSTPELILWEAFKQPHYVYDKKLGWIDITSYEPDGPNNTARISAVAGKMHGAFHIVRCVNGKKEEKIHSVFFKTGEGRMIATYAGQNVNPLPPYVAEPALVQLPFDTAAQTARAVYDALAPNDLTDPAKDYRVAVAAVFFNTETGKSEVAILNRHDLNGGK